MRSWIDINKNAFAHNVAVVRKLVRHDVALGIVLKANAYGHGLKELALLAESNSSISWLFVSTIEEALFLRQLGCKKEILVLAYADKALICEAIRNNIIVSITDKNVTEDIAQISLKMDIPARVHIKIDMGMNRLGVFPHELSTIMGSFPELTIEGMFTHIGITNNPDDTLVESAVGAFHDVCRRVDPQKKLLWHSGASGLVWSDRVQDMIRAGTLVYGSWKSEVNRARIMAKSPQGVVPIITWKTTIMQIKHVVAGDAVGYDEAFRAPQAMRIAILPVGYADGYPRSLSQKGLVWIQGEYASVLGIVSMNLMAVDVSHISRAQIGSEVVLIGPHEHITPYALAQRAATNPNDITTGLRAEIYRKVVG